MNPLVIRRSTFEFSEQRELILRVCRGEDSTRLAVYLEKEFPIDFVKPEELVEWKEVLSNLVATVSRIANFPESEGANIPTAEAILKFILKIVKSAKEKRGFLHLKEICGLMTSTHPLISDLSIEVVFSCCIPTASISRNPQDDWLDTVEVPLPIGENALSILAATSEFINRNHSMRLFVEFGLLSSQTAQFFTNQLPDVRGDMLSVVSECLASSDRSRLDSAIVGLPDIAQWKIRTLHRALHCKAVERTDLLKTMLRCLFIVLHSRVSADDVQSCLHNSGGFLTELIGLCTSFNEVEPDIDQIQLAHLALENVLGLLESKLRRRSSVHVSSSIIDLLQLEAQRRGANSIFPNLVSGDDAWVSIFTASASLTKHLSSPNLDTSSYASIGNFIRLGLEMYAAGLQVRDVFVAADMRAISCVVTMVRELSATYSLVMSDPSDAHYQHGMLLCKALYCIGLSLDKTNYYHAVRDSGVLQSVLSIITLFSDISADQPLESIFRARPTSSNVLEAALNVVAAFVEKHSPQVLHAQGLQTSGFGYLFEPRFFALGERLLESFSSSSDNCWGSFFCVIQQIIDSEPAYIGLLLDSSLVAAMQSVTEGSILFASEEGAHRGTLENVIPHLQQFASAMTLTDRGRQFVTASGLLELIVKVTTHPYIVLPHSCGLTDEKVARIGSALGKLIAEHGVDFGRPLLTCVRKTFEEILTTINAAIDEDVDGFREELCMGSPRMQLLQRLTNLCQLTEGLISEVRRNNGEIVREILQSSVKDLLSAYRCCLPPSAQLMAQMSLYTNTSQGQQIGHGCCMRAITSLLRIASSSLQRELLRETLNQLDESIRFLTEPEGARVTGLLGRLPNATIVSPEFTGCEIVPAVVRNVVMTEWLCMIMSIALSSIHRSSSSSIIFEIADWRDRFERIFSVLRSVSLELATFAATVVDERSLSSSKIKPSLDMLLFEGKLAKVDGRRAERYELRVVGHGGALVREGIEIDGSRVVYVAEVGTEMVAYERKSNVAGIVRYRTEMGWISEYRRDHSKHAIVEVLNVVGVSDNQTELDGEVDGVASLLTIREGTYCVLSRLHQTMRQISVYLARLLCSSDFRVIASNPHQLQLAQSLSKYMTDFVLLEDQQLTATVKSLYFASIVRNIVSPGLEDKNGNFITVLLRKCTTSGLLEQVLTRFAEAVVLVNDEARKVPTDSDGLLSTLGRCACLCAHSLSGFVKKLVTRSIFKRILSNRAALVDEKGPFTAVQFLEPLLVSALQSIELIMTHCPSPHLPADLLESVLSISAELHRCVHGAVRDCQRVQQRADVGANSNMPYAPLRMQHMVQRFMNMGFSRNVVQQAISRARNPSDSDEVYQLLISSIMTDAAAALERDDAEESVDALTAQLHATNLIPPSLLDRRSSDDQSTLASPQSTEAAFSGDAAAQTLTTTAISPATAAAGTAAAAAATSTSIPMSSRNRRGIVGSTPLQSSPQQFSSTYTDLVGVLDHKLSKFLVSACGSYERVCLWEKKDAKSLFAHFKDVASTIKKTYESSNRIPLMSPHLLLEAIMDRAELLLSAGNVWNSWEVAGYIGFILSHTTKVPESALEHSRALALIDTVSHILGCWPDFSKRLQARLVGMVVFLSFLLVKTISSEKFVEEQLGLLLRHRANQGESKEDSDLAETKMSRESSFSSAALESTFRSLCRLLSTMATEDAQNSRQLCIAVVNALSQVVHFHNFADKFVSDGGVATVLALKCPADDTLDPSLSTTAFSHLLHRCVEAPAVLQAEFTVGIIEHFRAHANDTVRQSFEKLLLAHATLVSRSPEDFWVVCTRMLRFQRAGHHEVDGVKRPTLVVDIIDKNAEAEPLVITPARSRHALRPVVQVLLSPTSDECSFLQPYCVAEVLSQMTTKMQYGSELVLNIGNELVMSESTGSFWFIDSLLTVFGDYDVAREGQAVVTKSHRMFLPAVSRLLLHVSRSKCEEVVGSINRAFEKMVASFKQENTKYQLVVVRRLCGMLKMLTLPPRPELRPRSAVTQHDAAKVVDEMSKRNFLALISEVLNTLEQVDVNADNVMMVHIMSVIELLTRPSSLRNSRPTEETEGSHSAAADSVLLTPDSSSRPRTAVTAEAEDPAEGDEPAEGAARERPEQHSIVESILRAEIDALNHSQPGDAQGYAPRGDDRRILPASMREQLNRSRHEFEIQGSQAAGQAPFRTPPQVDRDVQLAIMRHMAVHPGSQAAESYFSSIINRLRGEYGLARETSSTADSDVPFHDDELLPQTVATTTSSSGPDHSAGFFNPFSELHVAVSHDTGSRPNDGLGGFNFLDPRGFLGTLGVPQFGGGRTPQSPGNVPGNQFGLEFENQAPSRWAQAAPGGANTEGDASDDAALGPVVARVFQQMLESSVFQDQHPSTEAGDESVADTSQSSASLTSRGGPIPDLHSLSLPGTSMQAVQDPNMRQIEEEEDDSIRGGSIPPLIEIESQDHEANEEMSVLTLPQEEHATVADDHVLVAGSRAMRDVRTQLMMGSAASAISGDEETLRSSPQSAAGDDDQETIRSNLLAEEKSEDDVFSSIVEDDHVARFQESTPLQDGETPPPAAPESVPTEAATEAAAPPHIEDPSGALQCPPGYDVEVFYSLPREMQQEVIQQHEDTSGNIRELVALSGFDYDTFMDLPDDIRQEVLEQARREHPTADPAPAQQAPTATEAENNLTFLSSLDLELRAEVLLTANQAFLDTLPPEVLAEAQSLRDRAATQWQHRELMSHQARAEDAMAMPPAPPMHEHFESEEEEDQGDEELFEFVDPYASRRSVGSDDPRGASSCRLPVHNGLVTLTRASSVQQYLPASLLSGVVNLVLSPNKQHNQLTDTILLTLHNFFQTPREKFLFCKFVIGLLTSNTMLLEESAELFSGSDAVQTLQSSQLSTLARKRLLFLLNSLCCSSPVFGLVGLFPRLTDVHVHFKPDSSIKFEYPEEFLSALTKGKKASLMLMSENINGTNSLFEVVLKSMPQMLHSIDSQQSFESVVCLLEQMSSALEGVPVDSTVLDATELPATEQEGHVTSQLPILLIDREAIMSLCVALLHEHCNQRTFTALAGILGRVARFRANFSAVAGEIGDLLSEMGARVARGLQSFCESNSQQASSGASSAATASSLREQPFSGREQGREVDQFVRIVFAMKSISRLNSSAREHSLFDLIGPESTSAVWNALEAALSVVSARWPSTEDADDQEDDHTVGITEARSTMIKLLPLVESFFVVVADDLLSSAGDNSEDGESAESPAAQAAPPSQLSDSEAKIPGRRFRQTKQFKRMNICVPMDSSSLHAGAGEKKAAGMVSVLSRSRSGNFERSRHRQLMSLVQTHSHLLNMAIRFQPQMLESSLASLVRVVPLRSSLSFKNKRKYFFTHLHRAHNAPRRSIHIQVRRGQVFEDSYQQLRGRSAEDLRGRLNVQFYGEQGIDAGGLTREWFMILSREIFNPNYALFTGADGSTFQPNPLSYINSNHLDYFKFVGRIIGKAVCEEQLMDAHFTRSFYKHVLGLPIEFGDIEATEPDYYKNLKLLLEHPIDDMGFSGMTFTAELQKFGKTEDVDLIQHGSQVFLTDENKSEYVRLVAHHRMTAGIFPQLDSFLTGFYEMVPPELICIFSPTELELLICGLPEVKVDELQLHTDYMHYRSTDPVIEWFWDALRSFNREERALFLQFVTGTSKVPLGGFSQLQGMRGVQKFSIHKSYSANDGALPTAHTCYNQLDLPEYSSSTELREKLLLAIKEGCEGFGFA